MLSTATSIHHPPIMQANPTSVAGANSGAKPASNDFESLLETAGTAASGGSQTPPSALSGLRQIMQINPPGGTSTGGILPVDPPAGGSALQQVQAMLLNPQSALSGATALQTLPIDPPSLGDGAGITA